MTTRNFVLFLAVAALLCACQGVSAGPIIGGIAGGVAVLDQLLAGGVIDPVQHHQLAAALTGVGQVAEQAITVAKQAEQAAAHAKEGTLSTEEGVGVAAGISGVAIAALNAYRNATRRAALAAPAVA